MWKGGGWKKESDTDYNDRGKFTITEESIREDLASDMSTLQRTAHHVVRMMSDLEPDLEFTIEVEEASPTTKSLRWILHCG